MTEPVDTSPSRWDALLAEYDAEPWPDWLSDDDMAAHCPDTRSGATP